MRAIKRTKVLDAFWKDTGNQRRELEEIGKELGVNQLDDWYNVSKRLVLKKAPFISQCYKNFSSALQTLFPEHKWDLNKLNGRKQWSLKKQRERMDELATQLGIKHFEDWYNVQRTQLYNNASFIQNHYTTLSAALQAIYPEHSWDHSRFTHTLSGYWKSISNQRARMDELAKEFKVTRLDDWYKVPRQQIYSNAPFISRYYSSIFSALRAIYPEHPWNELHYSRLPSGVISKSREQVFEFVNNMMKKYEIQKKDDWYKLSRKEWKLMRQAAAKYSPVGAILKAMYPRWETPISKPEILLQVSTSALSSSNSMKLF